MSRRRARGCPSTSRSG
ncbi:hypothetical protein E2I00_012790 [Balaenoptera physalus]|uniref:Uncharacterized protein n=1 Tax=Balaenoptera physalus TaxID=9770 RepID=A0A643BVN5_BALPH|nr:hypothetical protein E2I00_012790 [Balaenoptera physalus]